MYPLLGISILAASVNSILLNKAQVTKRNEIFKFNLFGVLVWCVILLVMNKGKIHINNQVIFYGVTYGLVQSFFILFKNLSMSSGSVSVTTLIGNCSLLISVFVSLVLWKENVTAWDIIGLGVLLIAIFMCTYKKTNASYSSKWKYYVPFFFIFAALVGIVFKAFGKSENSAYCDDMMLVAAVVMLICYFIAYMLTGGLKAECPDKKRKKRFLIYAAACGILSCLYNRLNIFLAGCMDAIIFFPTFNGGVVLVSAFLGMRLCKEHLEKIQKTGILVGVVSICLIGIL